jgi:hypothetical protein
MWTWGLRAATHRRAKALQAHQTGLDAVCETRATASRTIHFVESLFTLVTMAPWLKGGRWCAQGWSQHKLCKVAWSTEQVHYHN